MTEHILERLGLRPEAYDCLCRVAEQLELLAELNDADMFIDCLGDTGTALVAAQAASRWSFSNYTASAVGHIARREDEPAVYQAFESGLPVKDLKARTQEQRSVMQDVAPIRTPDGAIVGVLICERDITRELRREQKLRALENQEEAAADSLPEGVTLYREMNHRVKNQLQLLSSVLRIQSRRSEHDETKQLLLEDAARLDAISTTYDAIRPGCSVHLLSLLQKTCAQLQTLVEPDTITICAEGDAIAIRDSQAVTLQMVVNEVVVNAIRHGFTPGEAGHIRVLLQDGNAHLSICVQDSGHGFTPALAEPHGGTRLIASVVREKLHGELRWSSGATGTSVYVTIPKTE